MEVCTVRWVDGCVRLIDQTKLPLAEEYVDCTDYRQVAEAIRTMKVRGAPAIGVAAALGLALAAATSNATSTEALLADIRTARDELAATRPTAVNLFWSLDRMMTALDKAAALDGADLRQRLLDEAIAIQEEDTELNQAIGKYGADLIEDGDGVLTHCNAGALACAGYGTALGVIRSAWEAGKRLHVFVDETRPLLQGARLTAWELTRLGIPMTLITDNMAGYFMQQGAIKRVVVGADRIAANGDTANKIGTYSVATLAHAHGIPFYVAAPTSTIDISLASGSEIPIEQRAAVEVTVVGNSRLAPDGVTVANPAFDVTPNRLIAAIITERGIIKPPFGDGIARLGLSAVHK